MKRKITLGIIILFLISLVYGCDSQFQNVPSFQYPAESDTDTVDMELKTEMPDDFAFSASYGYLGRNNIDTYNNTFTKDLVEAGTETIDFDIPIETMRSIFVEFVEQNIFEMPDDINVHALATMSDLRSHTHPANLYILTYTYNGETRTVICDDEGPWDANEGPPAYRYRLSTFIGFITEYVHGTNEYKDMLPVVGGYE
jgi:hypothetical protein